MGLFKVLFIILVIYFVIRFVSRFILPFLLGGYVRNIHRQMQQQQEEALHRKKKNTDGKVTINYTPKPNKNFGKDEGDYVDFEDIK